MMIIIRIISAIRVIRIKKYVQVNCYIVRFNHINAFDV